MSQTLWSKKTSAKQRRERVISRLEAQLKVGSKPFATKQAARGPVEYKGLFGPNTDLTESDKKRIQKEIETLKTRI